MKCRPEEMIVFDLDYGELIRPPFQILSGRGWGQCINATNEYLIVYGSKHERERSIFDTSPYVLPPGNTTPDRWDCEGFFVPSDRKLRQWRKARNGPLAVKFWNFRRFRVELAAAGAYRCPWDNGVFQPSQINWAIPNLSYPEILSRICAGREHFRNEPL